MDYAPSFISIINDWQWIFISSLPVIMWYTVQQDGRHPHRESAILILIGIFSTMLISHILIGYWQVHETMHTDSFFTSNGNHRSHILGDPCFVSVWVVILTIIASVRLRESLLLFFLSIWIVNGAISIGNIFWQDVFYESLIGLVMGSLILLLKKRFCRFSFGVEQIFTHQANFIYPFAFLVLLDINQDLLFFNTMFFFMFGVQL